MGYGVGPGCCLDIDCRYGETVSIVRNVFRALPQHAHISRGSRGANGVDWLPFYVEFTATAEIHTIGFFAEWGCDDSSYDVDNLVLETAP